MNRKPILPQSKRCLRPLAAALVLAAAASPAAAVTYCVGNVTELRNAAAAISASETQFDLRIKSGYYALTAVPSETYAVKIQRRFTTDTVAGQPHRISGTWNSNCSQQAAEINAGTTTVLDGQGVTGTLGISRLNWLGGGPPDLAPVQLVIERLQLANSLESGIRITTASTNSVEYWRNLDVTVERVRAELSESAGLALSTGATTLVRNSVLLGNQRMAIEIDAGEGQIHLYNNTLRYNRVGSGDQNTQVFLRSTAANYFFNNLIADGSYSGPAVEVRIADGNAFVRNNRFVGQVIQQSPDLLIQSDNTAVVPQFVNAQNSRLLASSPLRDLGRAVTIPGLGAADFDGATRVQGSAAELGAFELPPLTLLGPSLAYNPVPGNAPANGGQVVFTGVTTVGSSGTGSIAVTPSGGSGGGTTSLSAFTLSGQDAASFVRTSAATLSFTAGVATAQNVTYSCTAGSTQRSAFLQATETITGGLTTQRYWWLVCPAGSSLGPSLAFNPAAGASAGTGGPVNFTGVTSAGSSGSGSIVVTPSGGVGAGTTTLSNFALSGTDAAAFTRTSAATLSFTAGLVVSQEITLTCTSGASQRTANLQATQTVTGGATTQRFWVLVCPAGTTAGPTLSFNPAPGASAGTGGPVSFTGVTNAGSTGNGSIAVSSSGGNGGGITSLSSFTLSGADAAFFTRTSASGFNFTAGSNSTQNITYTCTSGASQRSANLQATQVTAGGGTTQRHWVLVCPAGSSSEGIFAGGFEN